MPKEKPRNENPQPVRFSLTDEMPTLSTYFDTSRAYSKHKISAQRISRGRLLLKTACDIESSSMSRMCAFGLSETSALLGGRSISSGWGFIQSPAAPQEKPRSIMKRTVILEPCQCWLRRTVGGDDA